MASVREVYNALKDIANKEERGFVTPQEFNSFAPIAQTNIYNKMFSDFTKAETLRKRNLDSARDKSMLKQLKEDLSIFSKSSVISRATSNVNFVKPDDLGRIISLSTYGNIMLDVTTSSPIDVVYDEDKFSYMMASTLSKPSESRPVAFLDSEIRVYPTSIKKVSLRYYKTPESIKVSTGVSNASMPKFGYTLVNNKEAYNAPTSFDFELPEHYVPQIVEEMAKLVGVNLRDTSVYTFAETETQKR
tara:strand:+ start:754 stop:1491 length:738 start_codon:yes stop_codon:yes gene_type:complete